MNEESKRDEGGPADPMATAVANGYQEPEVASKEDRAAKVIADLEHAVKHNAPVALETIRELRDMLGVAEKVAEEETAEGEAGPAAK